MDQENAYSKGSEVKYLLKSKTSVDLVELLCHYQLYSCVNTRKSCGFAKAKGFIILFWECSIIGSSAEMLNWNEYTVDRFINATVITGTSVEHFKWTAYNTTHFLICRPWLKNHLHAYVLLNQPSFHRNAQEAAGCRSGLYIPETSCCDGWGRSYEYSWLWLASDVYGLIGQKHVVDHIQKKREKIVGNS